MILKPKTMEESEIRERALEAHKKYDLVAMQVARAIEQGDNTKKNAILLYLLSGRPTSMMLALKMFGIGCYRDVICDLKKTWNIGYYTEKSKGEHGVAYYHVHYIKDFPIEYIKSRSEM